MIKNFIKIAFRVFSKNALTTGINILGLSLGFFSFIVLSLFVYDEINYDNWHKLSNKTFRLTTIDEALGVSSNEVAITNPSMATAAREELSSVLNSSRMMNAGEIRLEKNYEAYYAENAKYVEKEFFEIFDLMDYDSLLLQRFDQPLKMIITESFAEKVFKKSENVEGETLRFQEQNWEILGTFPDPSGNSHLAYDVLLSMVPTQADSNLANYLNSWQGLGMIGYVVLDDQSKEKEVETQLRGLADKYDVPSFWVPQLQPLEEIHLGSQEIIFDNYQVNKGDSTYVYALGLVALLVLIIAAFNFMNLATAQSGGRAKEVGIRKVLGSRKSALVRQFLVESVFMTSLSLLLAFGIFMLSSDFFDLSQEVNLKVVLLENSQLIFAYILLAIGVGVLAGIYPAFILSKFNPINMLKGKFQTGSRGNALRKSLVTIQFVASVTMIITTLLVSQQISFLKNKDLGFDKDRLINLSINDQALSQNMDAFKDKIEALSFVEKTTYSSNMPGRGTGRTGVRLDSSSNADEEMWIVSVMSMDENYIDAMGIQLARGRNFDPSFGTDRDQAVIINQAMQKALGWDDAVNRELSVGNSMRKVVGVLEDFHFAGMREKIEPLMFFYNPEPSSNISFKLSAGDMKANVNQVEKIWFETFPDHPFDYQFFDREFDQLFRSDERFASLISKFTWLSIILSCLGLFGLSYFSAEQRRKEIGVRKVLGSGTLAIIVLLIKEFLILIGLGSLIAWPISYVIVNNWLENFQYRIVLLDVQNIAIFILATMITTVIAIMAIGYRSTIAAIANPIHALRDE